MRTGGIMKTKKAIPHQVDAVVSLQDTGPTKRDGQVPVYHTHGLRQYLGTCKIHKRFDCPHLKNWVPSKGMRKIIMREWEDNYEQVPKFCRCRTCFLG